MIEQLVSWLEFSCAWRCPKSVDIQNWILELTTGRDKVNMCIVLEIGLSSCKKLLTPMNCLAINQQDCFDCVSKAKPSLCCFDVWNKNALNPLKGTISKQETVPDVNKNNCYLLHHVQVWPVLIAATKRILEVLREWKLLLWRREWVRCFARDNHLAGEKTSWCSWCHHRCYLMLLFFPYDINLLIATSIPCLPWWGEVDTVRYHLPSSKLRHSETAWGHDKTSMKCTLISNKPILTTFETYPPPWSFSFALSHFPQGTTQWAMHDWHNKTGKFETQGMSNFTIHHSHHVLTTPPTPDQTLIH